ncbi:hypothetical protein XSR1_100094 [Xenorhabdus szentirmaii DSM 16338]|uniref:Uncharacterized protein n=1 Tax=Xenorhabdus szentirmaii DSM 16338 TaxID=1427518 RepID=W1IRI9_9GAMM|nr:hypothetical protein XSR1_100094 [Xenorhabdus szentirmaii DSM 16338]
MDLSCGYLNNSLVNKNMEPLPIVVTVALLSRHFADYSSHSHSP